MSERIQLNRPWMIAVWPGMGGVAISAGYYLIAKLGMHMLAEFRAIELFDVEHVEVKGGLVHTGRLPRSRMFVWNDPAGKRDIVLFLGEAQPPIGKYAFCHRLIQFARELGVERVFTFAAMATPMRPGQPSRVFAAAADEASLAEIQQSELEILDEGYIGGLNGVLLGVAAETQLGGACLLGEMPQVLANLPYPRAALAVLRKFRKIADLEIDLTELREQAEAMDGRLDEVLSQIEQAMGEEEAGETSAAPADEPEQAKLAAADQRHIEDLFQQAREDRSKAYELKRELDRLEVFRDYEDRFLDLFKRPG